MFQDSCYGTPEFSGTLAARLYGLYNIRVNVTARNQAEFLFLDWRQLALCWYSGFCSASSPPVESFPSTLAHSKSSQSPLPFFFFKFHYSLSERIFFIDLLVCWCPSLAEKKFLDVICPLHSWVPSSSKQCLARSKSSVSSGWMHESATDWGNEWTKERTNECRMLTIVQFQREPENPGSLMGLVEDRGVGRV